MGCCKDDGKSINKDSESINLTGLVLKLPSAILISILFVILSPFILIIIWYLAIASIFNINVNLTKILLLGNFNKKKKFNIDDDDDDDEKEFTEENYELVDVDIIK